MVQQHRFFNMVFKFKMTRPKYEHRRLHLVECIVVKVMLTKKRKISGSIEKKVSAQCSLFKHYKREYSSFHDTQTDLVV